MRQMRIDVIAAVVAAALVYIFLSGPTHSLAAAPTAAAQVSTPQEDSGVGSKEKPLVFDAASIKPNDSGLGGKGGRGGRGGAVQITTGRVFGKNVTARQIIREAYRVKDYQLSGGPSWLDSDRFDLDAKVESPADEHLLRPMLQTLLGDRFKLVVHRETKQIPIYALVVAKDGPKVRELKDGDPVPPQSPGSMLFVVEKMQDFVAGMNGEGQLGRPVVDKTGLLGRYVFDLRFEPDEDFISMVQRVCGLKFESEKTAMDIVVIDHIEKPSPN